MTIILDQIHTDKFYIAIYQNKFSTAYHVELCHTTDGIMYRQDKDYTYSTLKAAKRRFNALIKDLEG